MFCQKEHIGKENQLFPQNLKGRQAKTNSMLAHRVLNIFTSNEKKIMIKKIKVANNFAQKCNKFPNKTVEQLWHNSPVVP